VEAAHVELMLAHAPAHMFITDLRDEDLEDPEPDGTRTRGGALR
jgi:hypothetical protein